MKKLILFILIVFMFTPIFVYADTAGTNTFANILKLIFFIIFIIGIVMTIIGIIKMKK